MTKKVNKLLMFSLPVLAVLLVSTFVLPLFIRSKAITILETESGRKVHIEKVSINPFTLSVGVKGFAVDAGDGGPFLSIGMVRASLSAASLFKLALVVDEVQVESPSVQFARLAANTYSFNDILELQKAKAQSLPQKKSQSVFKFSINNILLENGTILFDDRAVAGGRKHSIRNLNVAIPFVGNFPYLLEKYTDPYISALVNDAPFTFSGKVKPFSTSRETSVHIDLKKFSLPEFMAYLPAKPNFDLSSGTLSAGVDVSYLVSSTKKPELSVKGLFGLNNVAVNFKNGRPLLRLPSLEVRAAKLEVFARRFLFDSILFDGLELFVSRNKTGEWNLTHLMPPSTRDSGPAVTQPAAVSESGKMKVLPLVQVAAFAFNNGTVHFRDMVPKGGFSSDTSQIDFSVTNFTTAPGTTADYELSLLLNNDAPLQADGTFSLIPFNVTVSCDVKNLKFQRRWPYLSKFLTSPVTGTADLSADARYSKEGGVVVERGHLLLRDFAVQYGDNEGFRLARFEVKDAGYDQNKQAVEIGETALLKGDVSLSREADGRLSILSLFKNHPVKSDSVPAQVMSSLHAQAESKRPVVPVQKQQNSGKISYRIKKISIGSFNAAFIDKLTPGKPRFSLTNTRLHLANVNGPKFTPAAVDFSSTFNKATPLSARGTLTPQPFAFKGNMKIGRLPLRDFEAYIPDNIKVFLLAGTADTVMDLNVALKDGKPTGSFSGTAGLRDFHAVDMIAEEDLLKWESLQLDGIKGTLEPFTLSLREIVLNNCFSRIIVRKDGTLNLQNLVEKGEISDSKTVAPASVRQPELPPVQQAQASVKKQIRIDAVTVQDATISFSDDHLARHFSTTFYKLGGRISGLSSDDTQRADVDLRGNLENNSPLQITGTINPLRDDLFMDLKISFRDIDLTPVTPYTAQFLGYAVEKGKLSLDLSYHIDKKKLLSQNKIFIDQFTFGERVESDQATSLPVKFGLALLKDRQGEIHLDVPVSGSTDDPKLSVWKLAFQALQNLLVKAVTAPFSFFSSLAGSDQDFSVVPFDAGSSVISVHEDQKLGSFAKILLDRPALKLELKGYVDREKDSEAYRLELFNRKVRKEKFLALSKAGTLQPGETLETIQIQGDEYATYLAAVYAKADFPKPRNALGLVKKLLPDEMNKLIIAHMVIGDPELQSLARERIMVIKNHLVMKGSVPAERIFLRNDDIYTVPKKETVNRSRVEISAIVQ
jgi:hypothetical protein